MFYYNYVITLSEGWSGYKLRPRTMSEDVETLLKAWTTAFSEEVLDYAQPPEVRDEEVSLTLLIQI